MTAFAAEYGERVLHTPNNPISIGITLSAVQHEAGDTVPRTTAAVEGQEPQRLAQRGMLDSADGPGQPSQPSIAPGNGTHSIADGQQTAALQGQPAAGDHSATSEELRCPTAAERRRRPVTFLGSMLFKRGVSGTRVVARGKKQTVAGFSFEGYGAHCDNYPCDYLTFAAALGTTHGDVDEFIRRLRLCLKAFKSC